MIKNFLKLFYAFSVIAIFIVSTAYADEQESISQLFDEADIYFMMGADNLINFHKWHKWKLISQKCNILVFDRQGYKAKSLKSVTFKRLNQKSLKFIKFKKVNISSSQLRKI